MKTEHEAFGSDPLRLEAFWRPVPYCRLSQVRIQVREAIGNAEDKAEQQEQI